MKPGDLPFGKPNPVSSGDGKHLVRLDPEKRPKPTRETEFQVTEPEVGTQLVEWRYVGDEEWNILCEIREPPDFPWHNGLAGLQGGIPLERFHVTKQQLDDLFPGGGPGSEDDPFLCGHPGNEPGGGHGDHDEVHPGDNLVDSDPIHPGDYPSYPSSGDCE